MARSHICPDGLWVPRAPPSHADYDSFQRGSVTAACEVAVFLRSTRRYSGLLPEATAADEYPAIDCSTTYGFPLLVCRSAVAVLVAACHRTVPPVPRTTHWSNCSPTASSLLDVMGRESMVCFFFSSRTCKANGDYIVKGVSSKLGYLCRCVITDKGLELECRIERELNTTLWTEWTIVVAWRWRRNKCECQYDYIQILYN
jgi:hypothetical protein